MKWPYIKAVLRQEAYVTKASLEVIFDIFLFTFANIILFGFIANYLAQDAAGTNKLQIESLVIAVVFWEALRICQYSTSVSSMWNVWSHNLSNMFIAPIKVTEYLTAHIIAAIIKSALILISCAVLVWLIFGISLLSLGILPVLFAYLNIVIFACAVGLVLVGFVFQFGTRIQALTWGVIFMIQPLCAVFFPVSVLPGFLQPLAYAFPVTYFFEWIRALYVDTGYSATRLVFAFVFNILFFLAACYIFSRQLSAAKRSGQLVRNDL